MNAKTTGAAIAVAAAALFLAGPIVPANAASHAQVKCSGINSCKGTSECKTATSACKGQNSCKGHGWVHTKTAKECQEKGGKVVKS